MSWRARANAAAERSARWLPAIQLIGFAGAVGVVIAMAVIAARDVKLGTLDWGLLVPAVGCAVIWWLALAIGWGVVASGRPARRDASLWCRTQVLRYLPGGIWAPASRVATAGGHLLDRFTTVAAENVVALAAALSIGGLALALSGQWYWLPLVAAAAGPIAAARLTAGRTRVDRTRLRGVTAVYLAGFAFYVASAAFTQWAVSGPHDLMLVAGSAAIAWGAGLVVVIAPGGIGVRELVYVGLLAHHIDGTDATAGAITARLVTIVAELVVLVLVGAPQMKNLA